MTINLFYHDKTTYNVVFSNNSKIIYYITYDLNDLKLINFINMNYVKKTLIYEEKINL